VTPARSPPCAIDSVAPRSSVTAFLPRLRGRWRAAPEGGSAAYPPSASLSLRSSSAPPPQTGEEREMRAAKDSEPPLEGGSKCARQSSARGFAEEHPPPIS